MGKPWVSQGFFPGHQLKFQSKRGFVASLGCYYDKQTCYNFNMNSASKNLFSVSKLLVALLLVVAINIPVAALGEESTATSTPESIPAVNDPVIATTTLPIATTTPSTATTTDEFLPPVSVPEEEAATTTGEVLGESTASETEEDVEENIEEEDSTEESIQPVIDIYIPPAPRLSVREFKKRIVPDSRAFHSCEAEVFRIDISSKASAKAGIMLQRDSDAPYEVEIGGLPLGIDITFSKNNLYRYTQGAGDRSLELTITNQSGSQKGNFSVPIIYTQKGAKDSSVICQINIVNQ